MCKLYCIAQDARRIRAALRLIKLTRVKLFIRQVDDRIFVIELIVPDKLRQRAIDAIRTTGALAFYNGQTKKPRVK